MERSESIKALAGALCKAQGEIENATKNAANPHFKSTYADLAEIINTVRPVLSRHGLAVAQIPGFANGIVTVETILTHESGEWLAGVSGAPAQKQDPQGVGSAVTYLRRYSLAALCGIAQEDDDGDAASQPHRNGKRADTFDPPTLPNEEVVHEPATVEQLEILCVLVKDKHVKDRERESVLQEVADGMTKLRALDLTHQTRAIIEKRSAKAVPPNGGHGEVTPNGGELPLGDKRPRAGRNAVEAGI